MIPEGQTEGPWGSPRVPDRGDAGIPEGPWPRGPGIPGAPRPRDQIDRLVTPKRKKQFWYRNASTSCESNFASERFDPEDQEDEDQVPSSDVEVYMSCSRLHEQSNVGLSVDLKLEEKA